jgi:uncharacterized membrane protein
MTTRKIARRARPPVPDSKLGPIIPPFPVQAKRKQTTFDGGAAWDPQSGGPGPAGPEFSFGDIDVLPPELAAPGSGEALPDPLLRKMESAFQADFSNVRVHPAAPEADSLSALAFTQGKHIHFAAGQYNPATPQGQRIIGHELAHVLQQREGRATVPVGRPTPINSPEHLEAEADRLGEQSQRGEPVSGQHHGSPHHGETSLPNVAPVQLMQRGNGRGRGGPSRGGRGHRAGRGRGQSNEEEQQPPPSQSQPSWAHVASGSARHSNEPQPQPAPQVPPDSAPPVSTPAQSAPPPQRSWADLFRSEPLPPSEEERDTPPQPLPQESPQPQLSLEQRNQLRKIPRRAQRNDRDFTATENRRRQPKAHLLDDGTLDPAGSGSHHGRPVTALEQLVTDSPARADSDRISWTNSNPSRNSRATEYAASASNPQTLYFKPRSAERARLLGNATTP